MTLSDFSFSEEVCRPPRLSRIYLGPVPARPPSFLAQGSHPPTVAGLSGTPYGAPVPTRGPAYSDNNNDNNNIKNVRLTSTHPTPLGPSVRSSLRLLGPRSGRVESRPGPRRPGPGRDEVDPTVLKSPYWYDVADPRISLLLLLASKQGTV